jgi:outer membrane lipoprotein SlyB
MGKNTGAGAVVGGAIGFAVGGPAGAAIGAGIGAGAGSIADARQDAKKAANELSRQLDAVNRQEEKPILPTTDSEQIRATKNLKALQLAQRSGRASTILTQDKFGG